MPRVPEHPFPRRRQAKASRAARARLMRCLEGFPVSIVFLIRAIAYGTSPGLARPPADPAKMAVVGGAPIDGAIGWGGSAIAENACRWSPRNRMSAGVPHRHRLSTALAERV